MTRVWMDWKLLSENRKRRADGEGYTRRKACNHIKLGRSQQHYIRRDQEDSGVCIQCKINVVENSLWDVTFIDYRLPLPRLCQLLQVTQPTPEDWEDTLPDEGGVDVNGIGTVLAEKLLSRHLALTWEHHLITEDSLWLVGVIKDSSHISK